MTKLKSIEIDGILESGYIESFIENKAFTPFPTIFSTERPDVIAGNLLEGRVAILTDNTPYVLIVPATFNLFFQSVSNGKETKTNSNAISTGSVTQMGFLTA